MKSLSLILAVLLLFAMVSCRRGDVAHTPAVTTEETVTTAGAEVEQTPIDAIEASLAKTLAAAESNYEFSQAYYAAAEAMNGLADTYYEKLMEYEGIVQYDDIFYSTDDFHGFISDMNTNWEEYSKRQLENYEGVVASVFQGGTAGGGVNAQYNYELAKYHATEMYDVGQLVGIE